jgi:hypothetical protein
MGLAADIIKPALLLHRRLAAQTNCPTVIVIVIIIIIIIISVIGHLAVDSAH